MRADATAAPTAMMADPAYRGWRVKPVGPRLRDLPTLLEMACRPDTNQLTSTAIAPPIASDRDVGRASHKTAPAQKNPSGTRMRARRAASAASSFAVSLLSTMRQPSIRSSRLRAVKRRAGTILRCGTDVDSGRRRRGSARHEIVLAHGPLRCGSVGPKIPTSGVPAPRDMHRAGIARDHQRGRLDQRHQVGDARRRRHGRRVVGCRRDCSASGCSPGPHRTSERRPWRLASSRDSSAKYTGGHRLFGQAAPGLMRAKGVPPASPRRDRPSSAMPGLRSSSGNVDVRHAHADGPQHREILVDDVRRSGSPAVSV